MADRVLKVELNSGLFMPVLGLGTWKSKPEEVTRAVETALEVGYRHIDCAYVYGNENEVGIGIRNSIKRGVASRRHIWVTSKLWNTYHRPNQVEAALRKSLHNLGLDYLDLYLIHWPFAYKEGDDLFPADANGKTIYSNADYKLTWKAMEDCVVKGLTRSIGLSNFNSQQVTDVLNVAKIKPVVNQIECHPYLNQFELSRFCKDRDIVITAYSPLGSPDRPWAKPDDVQLMDDENLKAMADKYRKSVAQILIRYQIEKGHTVIPKSVHRHRIKENFQVFDFKLSSEDIKQIDSFDCKGRFCSLEWVSDHPYYPFHAEF